jgi:sec-independent protein translocase protein TatC
MSKEEGMTLVEHLQELRKRIIWVTIVFALAMIVGFVFAKRFINFLKDMPPMNIFQLVMSHFTHEPIASSVIEWNVFSPWDPLRIYMSFAFAVGLVIAMPVILYHLWAFVKPGLREEERKASIMYIPFAFLLFLMGLAFGYFVVFPMAFFFTSTLTKSLELTQTYGVTQYFSFMFNILIPLSLVFELPIVVMFLTRIRILNPDRMRKMRKVSYMLLVIVSAIITPPDAISALIVAVPMIILYEFSVYLSKLVHRKQIAQDLAWEAEYGPK